MSEKEIIKRIYLDTMQEIKEEMQQIKDDLDRLKDSMDKHESKNLNHCKHIVLNTQRSENIHDPEKSES